MKKIIKTAIWFLVVALLVCNVGMFLYDIQLSDKVKYYEGEISSYKEENKSLEKNLNKIESLSFAASQAAEMNFNKKANPIFLDPLQVALNK